MSGAQLTYEEIDQLFEDAAACRMSTVRLYGGEPLVHPDIVRITESCIRHGLTPWVTTNGMLLRRKVDDLHKAGLHSISIGYYGTEADYDRYVQIPNSYAKLQEAVSYVRETYDDVELKLDLLLMRPTCTPEALDAAMSFALEYRLPTTVNLIHYSLPYFTDVEEDEESLQFRDKDRPALDEYVKRLLEYKRRHPGLVSRSTEGLASIPDWLVRRSEMKVPCDRMNMIWVGPNGTVQMCYVTFPMGNLRETRFRDMIRTKQHRDYADDCYDLKCPNCHCGFSSRVDKHRSSRKHYKNVYRDSYSG